MVRTQIYLTEDQRAEIAAIASQSGKRQSEVIREALDHFLEQRSRRRRKAILREAAGIWRDRTDLPDLDALRRAWDRD
ncbi:MAG: ribbon-helix-helix protein, CopG family [Acidobacteria bacterium]|nr:ribbon-helix-helix protein, CopG family [Acidobacteriota bacterium]